MTAALSPLARLRPARPVVAAFAAMGVCWGSFAADLPDLKTMLAVDETHLGLVLFTTPIAAVLAMLTAAALARRFGTRVLTVTTLAMSAAFVLPGQVPVWWLFPLAMAFCGAGTGVTDVLMNARTAAIEAETGRGLMNLTHAAYSFGYAGGALIVGGLRSVPLPPSVVMTVMALLAMALGLFTLERDGSIAGLERPKGKGAAHLGWVPVFGGAIILFTFMTENAAENWSALHIEKTLHGSPAAGAAGPAIIALTMGFARLAGQGLAARIAPLRLILGGGALAAVGALTAAFASGPAVAYVGFVVLGAGASVISPTAFTLVGRQAAKGARARAIARATMLGYFGYFIGPPVLGFVAGSFGLRAAFVFTALLVALDMALAPLLARQSHK
jgi:MFS family permease